MNIRSKPQSYEAIIFKDNMETCFNVQEFVKDNCAQLITEPTRKILSTIMGNIILESGDIIYKDEHGFIHVSKNNETFNRFFEVVEE